MNLFAITAERECKDCETRYTPPTTRGAAAFYLVAGLLVMAVGSYGLAMNVSLISEGFGSAGLPLCLGLTAFGGLGVWNGVRALWNSRKV